MALIRDMIVEQGTSFTADLVISYANNSLYDLNGHTANCAFRKHYASNTTVSFGTAIDVNTSIVTVSLAANQTSGIEHGRYVWDITVTDGNTVTRVLEGILTITPGVTS